MSNGGSTVPEMPSSVWDAIKGKRLIDGGWTVDGSQKWLHEKAKLWRLYGSSAPVGWTRAPMDQDSWDNVSGGTLDDQKNWIEVGRDDWYVRFLDGSEPISYTALVP